MVSDLVTSNYRNPSRQHKINRKVACTIIQYCTMCIYPCFILAYAASHSFTFCHCGIDLGIPRSLLCCLIMKKTFLFWFMLFTIIPRCMDNRAASSFGGTSFKKAHLQYFILVDPSIDIIFYSIEICFF